MKVDVEEWLLTDIFIFWYQSPTETHYLPVAGNSSKLLGGSWKWNLDLMVLLTNNIIGPLSYDNKEVKQVKYITEAVIKQTQMLKSGNCFSLS